MIDEQKKLGEIQRVLRLDTCRYPVAGSIGLNLFLLLNKGVEIQILLDIFKKRLVDWELSDVLDHQMTYAIRLSGWDGELLYEEIHKLFSLCEEIHALKELSLPFSVELYEQFEKSVRMRFQLEPGKARMVAHDKKEDWNVNLWWMKENIPADGL